MAEHFYLRGRRLGRKRLQRLLDDWAARTWPRVLNQPTVRRVARGWEAHAFAEGSIRGFGLHYRAWPFGWRFSVDIMLNALASRADWCIAYSLMRTLVAATGATLWRPDGRVMSLGEVTAANAESEAEDALLRSAAALRDVAENDQVARVCLHNPTYDLRIPVARFPRARQLPQFAGALEQMLIPLAARYQTAHVATILRDQCGTLATWPLTATIVGEVDVVVIPDGARMKRLRLTKALEILGRRAEQVQEQPRRWYLPELNLEVEENQMLYRQLRDAGEPL